MLATHRLRKVTCGLFEGQRCPLLVNQCLNRATRLYAGSLSLRSTCS